MGAMKEDMEDRTRSPKQLVGGEGLSNFERKEISSPE